MMLLIFVHLPCDMQYIICLGTLSPAAKQAANDAEKFIAIFVEFIERTNYCHHRLYRRHLIERP